jgi:hypothetical protein
MWTILLVLMKLLFPLQQGPQLAHSAAQDPLSTQQVDNAVAVAVARVGGCNVCAAVWRGKPCTVLLSGLPACNVYVLLSRC